MDNSEKKVVLCGGGTGGHIFPSIAIAETLKKEGCDLYYIGVKGKPEEKISEENDIPFYEFEFSGFPREVKKELFTWPLHLLKAVSKAKVYLKHFKPNLVFGTGGYSAAPVFIAAKSLKIPYIVHNLDVRLGLANKFCSSGASLLTLGFDIDFTEEIRTKTIVTGNPIRGSFKSIIKKDKAETLNKLNLDPNKKTLFVIGGSQGANAINEATLDIVKELILTHDIQVIHQTGESRFENFSRRIPAKVIDQYIAKPFFDDIEKYYHVSDLIVSRAGAMTTSEITALGKPAIFIPYPFAGNHQEANVTDLISAGGGMLIRQKDLRSNNLLKTITALITDEVKLKEMSEISHAAGNINATEDIARIILTSLEKEEEKEFLMSVV